MNPNLLWLIAAAQAVHVGLEENPRFVEWARAYNPEFDRRKFILGNAVIGGWMAACILLAVIHPAAWTLTLGLSTAAYIAFNFLYHAAATLASGVYSPGVVTGGAINIPAALYVYHAAWEAQALPAFALGLSLVLGFLPMLLILKSIGLRPRE